MENMFGSDSILYIKTGVSKGRTIITDSYFTAPLKVAKPFYKVKSNIAEVMVMSASAGVMAGDCYRTEIDMGESTAMTLQGQSYTKIHKMNEGCGRQQNMFTVREAAFLDYDPRPSIPFANSDYISDTSCFLSEGSQYLYSEIIACGREKSGERFGFRRYRSNNKVYYCNKLIFIDNQDLRPQDQELSGIGFFEGFSHQGTLAYFYDGMVREACMDRIYERLQGYSGIEAGISLTYKYGIIVRILANGSDYLENIIRDIRNEIMSMQLEKFILTEREC